MESYRTLSNLKNLKKKKHRARGQILNDFKAYQKNYSNPGLPWWLSGKESPCQCRRNMVLIPDLGRFHML